MGNHDLAKVLKDLLQDSEWENEEIKFQKLTDNIQ